MTSLLSERQEQILALITRSYIETGLPVSSKLLVERHNLDVSSATVRNEMSTLDGLGYLVQLHTSAGRIPTEKGYRYFVQRLLGEFELPVYEKHMIRHQFHQARLDIEQWMRLAAAILARTSQGASFITTPRPIFNRFKHVELISTQGRLVLMIVVLFGGEVKQQMLTLAEPLPQKRLSVTAERLNHLFEGMTLNEVTAQLALLDDPLEQDVTKLLLTVLKQANSREISNVYRDGIVNILDDEGTRHAVRILEERTFLASLLADTLKPGFSGVQVVIGGEGQWEELRDCTVILSHYGVAEELTGALAVLGPTRMAYGRNISAVRYVAALMSGFVHDYFMEKPRLEMLQRSALIEEN